jgi:alpha-glucosidase
MKYLWRFISFISLISFSSITCSSKTEIHSIQSPDGKIAVIFKIENGKAFYSILNDKQVIISDSHLGFQFSNMPSMDKSLSIKNIEESSFSETWEQAWGEKRFIDNKYNQLIVHLEEESKSGRKMDIIFRAFNEGIGFRYSFPLQEHIDSLIITKEETEFNLPKVYNAWWIPYACKENSYYESLYSHTAINKMDTVHTPVIIEAGNGHFLSIHEANLTDYAAMTLYCADSSRLTCDLVPWSDGIKVYAKAPMVTPWRTIRIAGNVGGLITNYLELNLNEPSKIEDRSWIKPEKYIGIWWGMHMGNYTWQIGPKHGATTQNVCRYIDFAAENGFSGVLVEGWNKGWEYDWANHGEKFSFTEPYPDFDLVKICQYAAKNHVELIGHHETGGATQNYENQMEAAFALCQKNGIHCVKTGYVGQLLDGKEWHDGQYGVRHYRKVIEMAARYQIMIDNHEPIKPTGLQRTYPNLMTQEGARGQEYNAWSSDGGNPPEHTTILPFTRILAGPLDFTPGVFNFANPANPKTRVQSTLANQLALYVVLYSPLQMACDLPTNYTLKQPFRFIKDVPADWQVTKVINGEIGEYITIARKDRNSDDWYLGSITDENARTLKIDLSFLDDGAEYETNIYADGEKADWKTNPTDFAYTEKIVRSSDQLILKLAPGGGQAIRFRLKK